MNIFEEAIRKKLRFETDKGTLNVEDIWDLDVKDLDIIYGNLKLAEKAVEIESLLTKNSGNSILQLKLDIVKYVVESKLTEQKEAELAVDRKAHKQRLLEIKHKKQNQKFEEMSEEELDAELAKLDE